jgi:hypothetical protein
LKALRKQRARAENMGFLPNDVVTRKNFMDKLFFDCSRGTSRTSKTQNLPRGSKES